jgi:hypothetical protein
LLPSDTRVLEMVCSPLDQENYLKEIGNTVNSTSGK